MHAFKDSVGREWQLRLTFADAEDIQEHVKIDIGVDADVQKLFTDRRTFLATIGMLLGDQLEKAGVNDDGLKRMFDGETWDAAREALEAEIYFFSPNRKIAERIIPAVRRRQMAMAEQMATKIESGEYDRVLVPSKPDTVSPASAESNGQAH